MAEQSKEILKDKHIRHAEVNNSVIFNNACVIAKRIDYSFPVKQGRTKRFQNIAMLNKFPLYLILNKLYLGIFYVLMF